MSAPSVIAACQSLFASLSAANFPGGVLPALYFGEAPPTTATGGQVQPTAQGYAVIRHTGATDRAYAFGVTTREDHDVEIEFYYPSLGDACAAAEAARLNGGTPAQRQGFDYGALALAAPYQVLAVRPRANRASYAGLGRNGARVHSWRLSYRIELLR